MTTLSQAIRDLSEQIQDLKLSDGVKTWTAPELLEALAQQDIQREPEDAPPSEREVIADNGWIYGLNPTAPFLYRVVR
jgi:hypothetical protein